MINTPPQVAIDCLSQKEELAMSIRETLNQHPILGNLGSIALLILALALVIYWLRPAPPQGYPKVYYYDMAKSGMDAVYLAKGGKWAPIPSPTDPTKEAVFAHIFSCAGNCGDKSTHFIGYLEKFTNEAKVAID